MILRLLKFLKQVLRKIGDFQSRLILSLFYIVILSPFAAIIKIFHDPLAILQGETLRMIRVSGPLNSIDGRPGNILSFSWFRSGTCTGWSNYCGCRRRTIFPDQTRLWIPTSGHRLLSPHGRDPCFTIGLCCIFWKALIEVWAFNTFLPANFPKFASCFSGVNDFLVRRQAMGEADHTKIPGYCTVQNCLFGTSPIPCRQRTARWLPPRLTV